MSVASFKCVAIIALTLPIVLCLIVIPERATISYINPRYIEYAEINVKRYGRKSPYYINLWGKTKTTWANNVTVDIYFYEFLHNEYRRTFVELHYKFCYLLNEEPYIGAMLIGDGVKCPLPPGVYELYNMTLNTENFPNVWPFEKAMIVTNVSHTETRELIATGSGVAVFKSSKKNKKT